MAKKYLDNNGLLYLWGKIKATFVADLSYNSSTHQITKTKNGSVSNIVSVPYKTSELTNDSGYITSADIPEGASASTVTPIMDGTASKGSDNGFARGDHIHPHDTTKVDKVEGKGLSTNDYTTAEKTKLEGIESGAEANVLEGVQVNGTDLTITDKKVNVPVFTGATTSANGTVGLVPAPAKNKNICLLFGSGNWDTLDPQVFNNPNDVRFVFDTANTDTVLDYKVNAATTTASGVMSASDKTKLDGIREGANVKGSIVTKTSSYPSDAVLSCYDTATGEYSDFRVYSTQEMDTMFSGATTILNSKVDKVEGKGLSTNDYTDADKTKLGKLVFDGSSKIDSSILPSYVDDVVEAYARSGQTALSQNWLATGSASGAVITPEAGVIYILMADSGDYSANTQFRWSGTTYVKMADGGVSAITNAEIDTIVAS